MKLSEHFTLHEFTRSGSADRLGINNTPDEDHIQNMKDLCEFALEPVRSKFGPVTITSGYRCTKLNKAIGGSTNSQHRKGEAADMEVRGSSPRKLVSNSEVAIWITENLTFDQCILEFWEVGDRNSGWIHVSFKKGGPNRNMKLTSHKNGKRTIYRLADW